MLPKSIKNKVKELWNKFWSGGISNPLNAIEQITYLLFLKQLDENDEFNKRNALELKTKFISIFEGNFTLFDEKNRKKRINKATLRWSSFTELPQDAMFLLVQSQVFPFIKQLNEKESHFARNLVNASFLIPSGRLLKEAVKTIDDIYILLKKENRFIDAQGDFYEFLLDSLRTSGKNGQFRTPTHIIELMVELLEPKIKDKIADPACGTAGYLIGAYKYIVTQNTSEKHRKLDENGFSRGSLGDRLVDESDKRKLREATFHGFDIDPTMIRIALMNLMMHGITKPKIDYTDTLSKNYNEDNEYQIILANPPFTGSIDSGDLNETFTINTTKSELLFLERIYKMLSVGGTAGVIVPQGVLYSKNKAFVETRKLLINNCNLKAVITMPSGVFKPYAGVTTAILIITKGEITENIWFYDMKSDGRTLDDKRSELKTATGERDFGDLHDIINLFKTNRLNLDRKQKQFAVSREEIELNNYDLSVNTYKEEVYEEMVYEAPETIISRLSKIEKRINSQIKEIKKILE